MASLVRADAATSRFSAEVWNGGLRDVVKLHPHTSILGMFGSRLYVVCDRKDDGVRIVLREGRTVLGMIAATDDNELTLSEARGTDDGLDALVTKIITVWTPLSSGERDDRFMIVSPEHNI